MNEQIKELYHKAHDTSDVEGSFPQYFSATKFAKLIVEKCANIADDNWNFGKRPVGDIIREQLGDK